MVEKDISDGKTSIQFYLNSYFFLSSVLQVMHLRVIFLNLHLVKLTKKT